MHRELAARDGVALLVVLPAAPGELHRFSEELGIDATLLADPTWSAYRAYGLRRGSWRDVWLSLPTWLAYARLVARGRRLRRPQQDVYTLGGDILVDREGRIAWAHRSRHPADRPPVSEVLRQINLLS